jgi:hypothetical protein
METKSEKDLLATADIKISEGQLRIGAQLFDLQNIKQINVLQQTPVKDAGKALFAIGVIACIFGSRWFLAGGVFFVLLSLVSLFDNSKKLSVALVSDTGDKTVYASYNEKTISALADALRKELKREK